MTAFEKSALQAAHPFGGNVIADHAYVVRKLETRGLVEIVSRETLDDSLNYILTPAGKDAHKAL
jgi:hypothetical protein